MPPLSRNKGSDRAWFRSCNLWSLPIPSQGPVSVQDARPLTTGNQIIECLDVSPDGKWIAVNSNETGNLDIFKMPVGGGEPVPLTTDPAMDGCPRWSPDGTEIAFHSFRTGSRDLFVISADGGPARPLTDDPAHEYHPHWSPDGTRVVFYSNRSGVFEIYVLTRASGEPPVQLTFDGGAYPRWSPDGRLIAYALAAGGVAIIPPEGGKPRPFADFGDWPMWSKDGQTIYFRENPPYERVGIWSVPLSGGDPELLVRFDDPVRRPVRYEWSSDGENFYFTLTEFEADVWVMELGDSAK